MNTDNTDKFFNLLKDLGFYYLKIDETNWYDYRGFMEPAYLPHCVPRISEKTVLKVLTKSGRPFVRWDTEFSQSKKTHWWYVLRRKPWNIQEASRNTRSKIRRGMKKFITRVVTVPEIREYGYKICLCAEQRYGRKGFVVSKDKFNAKISAAEKHTDAFEFYGIFCQDKLIGFSENYIQNNAVFLVSIWYDPYYLRSYSSYVFTQGILEHYINRRNFEYVLDGNRNIHHKTNVQNFLIDVFGFTKEYAKLNVLYSKKFGTVVKAAYPFRQIFDKLSKKTNNSFIDNVSAVLKQECIRRTFIIKN